MRRDVPVEVGRARLRQAERERGLADLARAGDERHLARQVGAQRGGEVTRSGRSGHAATILGFLPIVKNTRVSFRLWKKIDARAASQLKPLA